MSSETLQQLVAKLDQMNDCHMQMIELGERKSKLLSKMK